MEGAIRQTGVPCPKRAISLTRPVRGLMKRAAWILLVLAVGLLFLAAIFSRPWTPSCAFGCGFTSSADVQAGQASCTPSETGGVCVVPVENTGGAEAVAVGCTVLDNGTSVVGKVGGTTTFAAPTQAYVSFSCAFIGSEPVSGAEIVGEILLSDGLSAVPFSGTWS